MSEEGWKSFGIIRGPGLPAPSGQFAVGCVDLMQKLEGDSDGLLVRLFYPSSVNLREKTAGYQYAKWIPHKRYTEGAYAFRRKRFAGLMATISNFLLGMYVLPLT